MTSDEIKQFSKQFQKEHGIEMPKPDFSKRSQFIVSSEAVRLTDPCYSMDTWCAGTLNNVLNGVWLGLTHSLTDDFDFNLELAYLKQRYELKKEFDAQIDQMKKILEEEGVKHEALGESATYRSFSTLRILALKAEIKSIDNRVKLKKIIDYVESDKFLNLFYVNSGVTVDEELSDAKNGIFYRRVGGLFAVHGLYVDEPRFSNDNIINTFKTQSVRSDIHVGVDSGQAGIFDLEAFKSVESGTKDLPESKHEQFYSACCNWTGSSDSDPIMVTIGNDSLSMGINSSSGFGDGGYSAYCISDDEGKVIAIAIDYMLIIGDGEEDE